MADEKEKEAAEKPGFFSRIGGAGMSLLGMGKSLLVGAKDAAVAIYNDPKHSAAVVVDGAEHGLTHLPALPGYALDILDKTREVVLGDEGFYEGSAGKGIADTLYLGDIKSGLDNLESKVGWQPEIKGDGDLALHFGGQVLGAGAGVGLVVKGTSAAVAASSASRTGTIAAPGAQATAATTVGRSAVTTPAVTTSQTTTLGGIAGQTFEKVGNAVIHPIKTFRKVAGAATIATGADIAATGGEYTIKPAANFVKNKTNEKIKESFGPYADYVLPAVGLLGSLFMPSEGFMGWAKSFVQLACLAVIVNVAAKQFAGVDLFDKGKQLLRDFTGASTGTEPAAPAAAAPALKKDQPAPAIPGIAPGGM